MGHEEDGVWRSWAEGWAHLHVRCDDLIDFLHGGITAALGLLDQIRVASLLRTKEIDVKHFFR